ncbi:MAG TPA: putative toxin-antitoxin system toxin component, PIN family [Nitrospirae bacterium]|nr:putative toxin-antitoxin system toxin component, PIN family [Nitrospirota bacterium]
MRVVIDTNVFVSSFFGGNPRTIIDLWKDGAITLCLSRDILDEYVDVLNRLGMRDEKELKELLSFFSEGFNILFTTKTPEINIVDNDPADNKFIECALALKAKVIITGDKHLLSVKKFGEIGIMTPKKFLEIYHD